MKVFACAYLWVYEGCSEPQAVFSTREKAEAWAAAEVPKGYIDGVEIAELEIDNPEFEAPA